MSPWKMSPRKMSPWCASCLLLLLVLSARPPPVTGRVSSTVVPATSPAVSWYGRTLVETFDGDEGVVFDMPAVYARFVVRGTTAVHMVYRGGAFKHKFRVDVDGELIGRWDTQSQASASISLVTGLDAGRAHSVLVTKISQPREYGRENRAGFDSGDGSIAILGFELSAGGAAEVWPDVRDRRVEFIGDSQTAGTGNLVNLLSGSCSTVEGLFTLSSSYLSWAGYFCRAFDADCRVLAWAGLGLVDNSGGGLGHYTAPNIFRRTIASRETGPEDYDPRPWQPEVVFLALGENDAGAGVDMGVFEDAVVDFATEIRNTYQSNPFLYFVCMPMEDAPTYCPAMERAATRYRGSFGTGSGLFLDLYNPAVKQLGCGAHPNYQNTEALVNLHKDAIIARHNWGPHPSPPPPPSPSSSPRPSLSPAPQPASPSGTGSRTATPRPAPSQGASASRTPTISGTRTPSPSAAQPPQVGGPASPSPPPSPQQGGAVVVEPVPSAASSPVAPGGTDGASCTCTCATIACCTQADIAIVNGCSPGDDGVHPAVLVATGVVAFGAVGAAAWAWTQWRAAAALAAGNPKARQHGDRLAAVGSPTPRCGQRPGRARRSGERRSQASRSRSERRRSRSERRKRKERRSGGESRRQSRERSRSRA